MNANPLLTQIFNRSDTMIFLWVALVAIGLAVLAFAARPGQPAALGHLLLLGFCFFAVTHLLAMQWLLKQWAALHLALTETPNWKLASEGVRGELGGAIAVPQLQWVLPFHLGFDAFVLFGLWWLSRKRGQ